ncbi:hypothetical protein [Nocardia sp. NPDC005825]|uniref:hypothetical protein n=1 Tax=unclassified Nocardia TaxID=2637762 RepID=UPI0034022AF3
MTGNRAVRAGLATLALGAALTVAAGPAAAAGIPLMPVGDNSATPVYSPLDLLSTGSGALSYLLNPPKPSTDPCRGMCG